MKSNKGFTLIELIVVIVIMGILSTILIISISASFSANAKKSAVEINSYIGRCRTDCMSKSGNTIFKLSLNGENKIIGTLYHDSSCIDSTVLGGSRVSCEIINKDGKSALTQDGVQISFNRSTGGEITEITDITLTGGGRTYTIKIVPSTGNHWIE